MNEMDNITHLFTSLKMRLITILIALLCSHAALANDPITLRKDQRISIIGNGFAEGMHRYGWLEMALQAQHPDLQLRFRNMGWQADTVSLRERPYKFGNMLEHLSDQQTDLLIVCYGMNESFDGPEGLEPFREQLGQWLQTLAETNFNGDTPAEIILVSPIAQEDSVLPRLAAKLVDIQERNEHISLYTDVMREVAMKMSIRFVDLFSPSQALYQTNERALTRNGIHPNEFGYWLLSQEILKQLGFASDGETGQASSGFGSLRETIWDKNWHFFMRWRPVNMEYIRGERRQPFGVENFPREFEMLDAMIQERDSKIWELAKQVSGSPFGSPPGDSEIWEITPYYSAPTRQNDNDSVREDG